MAVTIGTIGTIITVGAAALRVAGPLFRVTTTAAQRLASSRVKTAPQFDHSVSTNPADQNPTIDARPSLNPQTLFNSTNLHNTASARVEVGEVLQADISNAPTLKPKGTP